MEEKRFYSRIKILKPTTFETNTAKGEVERLDAEILDISAGGACIKTLRSLEAGRVIKLKLELKDADIYAPCIAEVMWAKPDNRKYKVGLQFLI